MKLLVVLISFFNVKPESPWSTIEIALLVLFCVGLLTVVVYHFLKFFEQVYSLHTNKPFFVFAHPFKRKLQPRDLRILETKFEFYKRLNKKHKRFFEHRVATFMADKEFVGRQNLEVTNEMRILISATAVMLTFGFRKYLIDIIDVILVYPGTYYSNINLEYHKGEFNPKLNALVLSWEDFLEGYDITNDNVNLGIHEITHAIHLNSLQEEDISAFLFKNIFRDLAEFLSLNESIRTKLMDSDYFRAYGFTNQFEFLAVSIETFIETPQEFKRDFPHIYKQIKQMLNFNFANY